MERGVPAAVRPPHAAEPRQDRPRPTPLRLADLDPGSRRRAVLRCGATITLSWVLIGAFYVGAHRHESGLRALLRLGVDIALIGAVFAWQIRRINVGRASRAARLEALGIVIALFLVLFSGIYLAMSHAAATTFTQRLDHARAALLHDHRLLDGGLRRHHAGTDPARLIVSAQMLLDLAIIGAVVRLLFNAARPDHRPADGPATRRPPSAWSVQVFVPAAGSSSQRDDCDQRPDGRTVGHGQSSSGAQRSWCQPGIRANRRGDRS